MFSFFRHFTIPSLSLTRNTVFSPFFLYFPYTGICCPLGVFGDTGEGGSEGGDRSGGGGGVTRICIPPTYGKGKKERPLLPFSAAAGEKIQNSLLPPPFLLRRHLRRRPPDRPTVRRRSAPPFAVREEMLRRARVCFESMVCERQRKTTVLMLGIIIYKVL